VIGNVMLFSAAAASAQTPAATAPAADRIFVNVNVGRQTKAIKDDYSFTFSLYGEDGVAQFSREAKGGLFPDVMAGMRVKQNFFIAVQGMVRTASADSPTVVSVPDPFAFESPRVVTGTLTAMAHRELWASLLATYVAPVRPHLDVMVFAGPSLVEMEHEVATFNPSSIVEPAPTVTFTRTTQSRTVWGFTAGADVRYMFSENVGAGVFGRVQAATVNLPGTGITIDAGGFQIGGGLRVRF
jgi:hypothetical protein